MLLLKEKIVFHCNQNIECLLDVQFTCHPSKKIDDPTQE